MHVIAAPTALEAALQQIADDRIALYLQNSLTQVLPPPPALAPCPMPQTHHTCFVWLFAVVRVWLAPLLLQALFNQMMQSVAQTWMMSPRESAHKPQPTTAH